MSVTERNPREWTISELRSLIRKLIETLVPGAHAFTHENGGADEINVAGLSGLLADPQNPGGPAGGVLSGTYPNPGFAEDIVTPGSGWHDAGETWTYASAITFTVPGDQTAKYTVGTKLRLTQTTVKYFHVLSSAYAAPNTTVTVITQTDYTLANAAITVPAYSRADLPVGFPGWFNYTPIVTGFSALWNVLARFHISGRAIIVLLGVEGISNATWFSVTAPVAADLVGGLYSYACAIRDNGVFGTTPGKAEQSAGSEDIGVYTNWAGAGWTASGIKSATFTAVYAM